MYYIRTADKLMRTARWVEQMEGGLERLKKIIIEDELGICAELDREMDELVGTYYDEWRAVVEDPERRKQFRQFVNTVCGGLRHVARFISNFVCAGRTQATDRTDY
jgi:nitrite reductase (NAD(P)H)